VSDRRRRATPIAHGVDDPRVLPTVDEVRARIEDLLDAGPCERVQDAERPVRRLGLALGPPAEPVPGDLDALLLHRSWGFEPAPGLGVLGCHDPFDHRLGLAHNPWLHERLGLTDAAPLAAKATLHTAPPDLAARVTRLFGGREGSGRARPARSPPPTSISTARRRRSSPTPCAPSSSTPPPARAPGSTSPAPSASPPPRRSTPPG